jgi:hypothetical protein
MFYVTCQFLNINQYLYLLFFATWQTLVWYKRFLGFSLCDMYHVEGRAQFLELGFIA